jgi:hypothetical protein
VRGAVWESATASAPLRARGPHASKWARRIGDSRGFGLGWREGVTAPAVCHPSRPAYVALCRACRCLRSGDAPPGRTEPRQPASSRRGCRDITDIQMDSVLGRRVGLGLGKLIDRSTVRPEETVAPGAGGRPNDGGSAEGLAPFGGDGLPRTRTASTLMVALGLEAGPVPERLWSATTPGLGTASSRWTVLAPSGSPFRERRRSCPT